jgi:abortive infection bacteriophage resistance protein
MIKEHLFKQNSKFKDVISLYNFDAELRILLFGVIEKNRNKLKNKINLSPLSKYNPWWFQDFDLFIDSRELVKH